MPDDDDITSNANDDAPVVEDPIAVQQQERLERKRAQDQRRAEQHREEIDDEDEELGRQRRQNVRVDVKLPLTIQTAGREAVGRTRDISATGIGFSTRLPIAVDQRGQVTVEFDDWHFTAAFIVRFAKPILAGHQVGVQFDEMSNEEQERLVKHVFDVQRSRIRERKE